MKLGVISLGCDKATVDSERLGGVLVGHGAVVTPDLPHADVILLNTCGFIDAAKQESIDAMLGAAKLKTEGTVKAVVAVGCLVQRYQKELQEEIPEVDLFLGFSDLHHLVPELSQRGLILDPVAGHPGVRQFLGDQPHIRYLKISEGCDHTCAFCAIPLMRGKHRSEPLARVVREAQQLEAQGAREIKLTQGIPQEKAKAIVKAIKDRKFKKAQASIQGEEIRVQSSSKDELQEVMAFLRLQDWGIELKYGNYRG